jgi:hypothetical protein
MCDVNIRLTNALFHKHDRPTHLEKYTKQREEHKTRREWSMRGTDYCSHTVVF